MADTNKETLVQKLTDIADGFRTSRSLTETLSLDDMAILAAVPITGGGGEGDKNLTVYTLDQFTFDGSTCTNFDASKNKYLGTLLNGCIIPYSNGGTVIDTIRGAELTNDSYSVSRFSGYNAVMLPENITEIANGCFNESTIEQIFIEDRVKIKGDRNFRNCPNLKTLDTTKIDVSEATQLRTLFQQCHSLATLDVSNWDTSNVTDIQFCFNGMTGLRTLDLSTWDTSKLVNMPYVFQSMTYLETLNLTGWDTSKVTNMTALFLEARYLKTVLGSIDMLSNLNATNMFYGCYALQDITLKNIRYSLSFVDCRSLSNASVLNIAQELWDKTGHPLQQISFYAVPLSYINNTYVKLIPITAAMREQDPYIDNKKPCEVCESTDAGAMTLRDYILSKNWAIS